MDAKMNSERRGPDPKALAIARATQAAVKNSVVILFGSRAAGTHQTESDVDLLLVFSGEQIAEISRAERAAKRYMNENPPPIRADIVAMDTENFHRCRRAKNHVAGQAYRKGIIMAPERLDFTGHYDDQYPESWPDVRDRLRSTYRHLGTFEREFAHPEGEQESYGFHAQQAIENSLKAWISAAGLEYDQVHNLDRIASGVLNDRMESQTLAGEQLKRLLDYTTATDPDQPGDSINWLTRYAVQYRYAGTNYTPNEDERQAFREEIILASRTFINQAQELTNTTNADLR